MNDVLTVIEKWNTSLFKKKANSKITGMIKINLVYFINELI